MSPKRARENGPQDAADSGHARKKQRTAEARTIQVQPTSDTGEGALTNSMIGLPGAINVEKFTEARGFEITAMQGAMEAAKGNATQRAFQALPRSLRRRAASHDVRRVPVRLREKARAEMDSTKHKASGKKPSRKGEAKQITRTESFLKRQRDKTWLETHIWHAKRMHMRNLWGYRLSETPTEKSFRPSHRASVQGSILHDASYIATISIYGKQSTLEKLFLRCCDCQGVGPGAIRYTLGSRIHETHIYEPDGYPFGLIAPVTIIWRPLSRNISVLAEKSTSGPERKTRRGKSKKSELNNTTTKATPESSRTVWIRFHPSAWQEVWGAVQKAASLTLETIRKDKASYVDADQSDSIEPSKDKAVSNNSDGLQEEESIEIMDLRSQVNCFEITGPRSTQVLLGALNVVDDDDRPIFKQLWGQLKDLQTPGSVPRGMIIGLKVRDPRLNFPPKNAKLPTKSDNGRPSTNQSATFTTYPTEALAKSDLWDAVARKSRPRFKKAELDDRRRKNLIPGTALKPLRQDDVVPLLLIQRTVSGNADTTSQMHGWKLLLPQHWGMPFFSSLTFTGTRVAGLRERRTQVFEASAPDFPFDYPSTLAYKAEEIIYSRVERERWERKPPGKKVNWDAVGTRSPWRADWEVVLDIGPAEVEEGMLAAQREDNLGQEVARRMWLLRGPDASRIVKEVVDSPEPAVALRESVTSLRVKRGLPPLTTELLQSALVPVLVHMCARGAPDDLAAIYAAESDDDANDNELSVGTSPLIGYVTTGSYALSKGKGAALGVVSLVGLLKLSLGLVKVKDRDSATCRAARVEVLAT